MVNNSPEVKRIVELIQEEAKKQKGLDYVGKLQAICNEIDLEVGEVMRKERKKERNDTG